MRNADSYSYYGSSMGWGESAWAWQDSYDRLAKIGRPLGKALSHGGGKWSRQYEHARVDVFCPPPGNQANASGTIALLQETAA